MADSYPMDIIDGRRVPPRVFSADGTLTGTHQGSVVVQQGVDLFLRGTLQGSLWLEPNSRATIAGEQQGSVHVDEQAELVVTGRISGSTHIASGASVIVERSGRLAGSVTNYGSLVVRGEQGGEITGSGEVEVAPGGRIKRPTVRNGIRYYEWRS